MAKNTAPCRVCGKEFVPCGKSSAEIGAFNYREVACSPECGQEYLRRVLAARSPKVTPTNNVKGNELVIPSNTLEDKEDIEVSEDTEN